VQCWTALYLPPWHHVRSRLNSLRLDGGVSWYLRSQAAADSLVPLRRGANRFSTHGHTLKVDASSRSSRLRSDVAIRSAGFFAQLREGNKSAKLATSCLFPVDSANVHRATWFFNRDSLAKRNEPEGISHCRARFRLVTSPNYYQSLLTNRPTRRSGVRLKPPCKCCMR